VLVITLVAVHTSTWHLPKNL